MELRRAFEIERGRVVHGQQSRRGIDHECVIGIPGRDRKASCLARISIGSRDRADSRPIETILIERELRGCHYWGEFVDIAQDNLNRSSSRLQGITVIRNGHDQVKWWCGLKVQRGRIINR